MSVISRHGHYSEMYIEGLYLTSKFRSLTTYQHRYLIHSPALTSSQLQGAMDELEMQRKSHILRYFREDSIAVIHRSQ